MKEYPWTSTFGTTKYGTPSGKIITPAVTDIPPQKITPANYFFMTGTMWRKPHIHTDRCAERCKDCDCKK